MSSLCSVCETVQEQPSPCLEYGDTLDGMAVRGIPISGLWTLDSGLFLTRL
jgi:hypothetical protein